MEELEYSGLMYADLEWKNVKGEVFFKLKRKTDFGPIYYVFEKNEELLSEEEKILFKKSWEQITIGAGLCGVQLFDSREIMDAVQNQIKKVMESDEARAAMVEADRTGEVTLVRDVQVSLFDFGTQKVTGLTVGISVPAGASEKIKESFNVE